MLLNFYSLTLIFVFSLYLSFASPQNITRRTFGARTHDEQFSVAKNEKSKRSASSLRTNGQCGVSGEDTAKGPRVINGRKAERGEFPWQVGLYLKTEDKFEHSCGGAILASQWVVTAAHCVNDVKPENLKGVIGVNDLEKVKASDEIFFDRTIVNENYTIGPQNELINDIALLHVTKPIDFSSPLIKAVCLPAKGKTSYKVADVVGWGQTQPFGFTTTVLQTAVVYPFKERECVKRYKRKFHARKMICAGLRSGGRDACRGDSGGPLTQVTQGVNYLIGIVSFGIGCARQDYPGVYTRVSNYVNWINEHIAE